MKFDTITMGFLRPGGSKGALTQGVTYHVVIDPLPPRQFLMPFDQEECLDELAKLRYQRAVTAEESREALGKLSAAVTQILQPPQEPADMLHLDLLTEARELWALPFEAALGTDGEPLFTQRGRTVVLTRRAPVMLPERQLSWPARPRVLFAHASPKWTGLARVDSTAHEQALLDALQPWVNPLPGLTIVAGDQNSVLTTCADASLAKIREACRKAEEGGRPYTHVHLLAHGVEVQAGRKFSFKIALESEDEKPTSAEEIVAALIPPGESGGSWQGFPLVVTLAICDGGNVENTIFEEKGLAQLLHLEGVPVVVASQLPLTFTGSEVMTQHFYAGWMAGKDVRQVLHEMRVALKETEKAGHDWVSVVAYVRLPKNYEKYLTDVRLPSQFEAMLTASRYAETLSHNAIKDGRQYESVAQRLSKRVEKLEELLKLHSGMSGMSKEEKTALVQENYGLIGSTHKRLAELLFKRAAAEPAQAAQWLAESRSMLQKARDAYHQGYVNNTAHHWSGVQYLALEAALTGKVANIVHWFACCAAVTEEAEQADKDEMSRIWALGSKAEMGLLSLLVPPLPLPGGVSIGDAAAALVKMRDLVMKSSVEGPDKMFPIETTGDQFTRYVNWWTKDNGFFTERETDLAAEALKLAALLELKKEIEEKEEDKQKEDVGPAEGG